MPAPDFSRRYQSQKIRVEAAALRVRTAFLRLRTKAGFNPNQPRVPAGNPDGGQWTDGGGGSGRSEAGERIASAVGAARTIQAEGIPARVFRDKTGEASWSSYTENRRPDGTLASRTVSNRDGSRIVSEPQSRRAERNTVTLRDGSRFIFENEGDTQRVFDGKGRPVSEAVWTPDGPEPQPVVTPVFRDPRTAATEKLLQATAALYGWWMSSKESYEEVVFGFNAYELQTGNETLPPMWVGKRTREEGNKACERLKHVQDATNKAAAETPKIRYPNKALRGTAIHTKVRDAVAAENDPNYKAEESILKSKAEVPAEVTKYGRKDSIRVDVLERRSDDVVCVYDIKTGNSIVTRARYLEILSEVASAFSSAKRVLVIQVKPAE